MTITSGDLASAGKAPVVSFPGSFLDEEDKHPFRALKLSSDVASGVQDGSLQMVVFDSEIEKSHDEGLFIMDGSNIVGAIKIGYPIALTEDEFHFMKGLHGKDEYLEGMVAHRVLSVESFDEPYQISLDTDDLICNVESFLPQNVIKLKIVKNFVEERIVASPVLVPGQTDLHNEIYSEETVRAAAYFFLEHFLMDDDHGIDVMHDGEIVPEAIRPVQSFVLDEERTYNVDIRAIEDSEYPLEESTITFPKGTWILYARIISDTLWEKVKNGEYTGWSIAGLARVTELRKILARVA